MPTVHTYTTHNTSYNNNWCNWCNNFHIILSVMVHLIPFLSLLCLLFSVYCSGCQLCFIGHPQHPGGYFSFYLRLYTHTLKLKLLGKPWSFYVSEHVCKHCPTSSFLTAAFIYMPQTHRSFWAERIIMQRIVRPLTGVWRRMLWP